MDRRWPFVLFMVLLIALHLFLRVGLGIGFWDDPETLDRQWQVDRRFEPAVSRDQAHAMRAGWIRALERAKHWAQP